MVKMYNHIFSLYCRFLFYPFKMCNGQNVCIFPVLYGFPLLADNSTFLIEFHLV